MRNSLWSHTLARDSFFVVKYSILNVCFYINSVSCWFSIESHYIHLHFPMEYNIFFWYSSFKSKLWYCVFIEYFTCVWRFDLFIVNIVFWIVRKVILMTDAWNSNEFSYVYVKQHSKVLAFVFMYTCLIMYWAGF